MKRFTVLLLIFLMTGSAFAEIGGWWGQISYRQRFEEAKEYTDFTFQGEPGTLRYTDTNTKTRLGYQIGFKMDVSDYLDIGLTLRSGVNSVMWQDIDNVNGLKPGLQEAYLDWTPPYGRLELGKIPQKGNAMWDLYACANLTDWRLYSPLDGVFNDRLGALNGARLSVPLEFENLSIQPRAIYHADYVDGAKRSYEDSEQVDVNDLDWHIFLVGLNAKYDVPDMVEFDLDFDYGFPERLGNKRAQGGKDSVYVDESIWGLNLKSQFDEQYLNAMLDIGYAYSERDSVFKSTFMDVKGSLEYMGVRGTVRYQNDVHESQYGIYTGSEYIQSAWHFYLNKTIWDLDWQPRIIMFKYEYDHQGMKNTKRELMRVELTTTYRF